MRSMRKMVEQMMSKLTPSQLPQKRLSRFTVDLLFHSMPNHSWGDLPKVKIGGKGASPRNRWIIPRFDIRGDHSLQSVVEMFFCPYRPRLPTLY
jgi:hypothetical protein